MTKERGKEVMKNKRGLADFIRRKDFWKKNVGVIYVFIFFVVVYFSYLQEIWSFVLDFTDTKFNSILSQFVSKDFISLWIIIGFAYLDFTLFKVFKVRRFSLRRLSVAVFIALVLMTARKVSFVPTVIPGISYLWMLLSVPVCIMLEELKKIFVIERKHTAVSAKFVSNLPDKNKLETGRLKYARTLAEMICNTDKSKESYAIGVVGDWGSGKTSFSEAVVKLLENQFVVIKFRPWDCNSPKDIVTSFFNLLNRELSNYNQDFNNVIDAYLKALVKLTGNYGSLLAPLFDKSKDSTDTENLKSAIEESLLQLNKPVLIMIDDIDRLEISELFETLRIIRNTANFRNVVYLASYDKAYVASQFKLKGIDGNNFLEKIFPIEIYLPHCEDYSVAGSLKLAIRQMVPKAEANSLIDRLSEDDNRHICHVLSTFRRAKNFANSFSIDFNYLLNNEETAEVNKRDLLFLELIKFSDSNLYDSLRKNPDKYLYVAFDNKKLSLEYNLRAGIFGETIEKKINEDIKYEGEPIKNKDARYFLENLFDETRSESNRISIASNFSHYFTLYPSERVVTEKEFNELRSSNPDQQSRMVHDWCNKRARKIAHSIGRHFVTLPPEKMAADIHLKNFSLLMLWVREEPDDLAFVVSIVKAYFIRLKKLDDVRYYQILKETIEKTHNNILMARCLVLLYESDAEISNGAVTIEQIEELITLNLIKFMQRNKCDAIDLLKVGSRFRKFFSIHSVPVRQFFVSTTSNVNIIFPKLLSYYGEHKSKNYRELRDVLETMNKTGVRAENERIFGNKDGEFDRFISQCFISESADDCIEGNTNSNS